MTEKPLHFVIPTYRLRDVGEAVEAYDENFRRCGHIAPITVFDDSPQANHDKYFSRLERIAPHNELFYVGPAEKEEFLGFLCKRLKDRKLDILVRNLFRPSYGGNRNFTLMYTLGDHMVSADDDMRPYALMGHSPEALEKAEISRGKLIPHGGEGPIRKSFDILQSFRDVLGRTVAEVPTNFERGELLNDTSMDLETNTSLGLARENSLFLQEGKIAKSAVIKMAQTFRTGTNDIDAADYIDLFLEDHDRRDVEALNDDYVLVNFRPCVTTVNWRMDCGVAGYDNSAGLPPFFPTRLRFEDYIYRLWIQQSGFAAAHVDSAQTHTKNNYMRAPMASELLNEAVCSLLKNRIRDSIRKLDETHITFDYEGEVTAEDSLQMLELARALHARVLDATAQAKSEERRQALMGFGTGLSRVYHDFEPDFFQQSVSRVVEDEVRLIRSSLEIWPTLLEIVYFRKSCHALPIRRVKPQTGARLLPSPEKTAQRAKVMALKSDRPKAAVVRSGPV